MGLFSRAPKNIPDDWSVKEVTGLANWMRHQEPYPSLREVMESAVSNSNLVNEDVNKVSALASLYTMWKNVGSHMFVSGGSKAGAEGLSKLFERTDFTEDMLFRYFSHQGATGVAVFNTLVEHTQEQFPEFLVEQINEGKHAPQLGGKDRV